MSGAAIAVGAAMFLYGAYRARKARRKYDPDVKMTYPSLSDVEVQILETQLEYAKGLSEETPEDKAGKAYIYKALGKLEPSMTPGQNAEVVREYSRIRMDLEETALREKERIAGMNIDEMANKGLINPQTANRIKLQRQAALEAVLKQQKRSVAVAQGAAERDAFFKRQGLLLSGIDTTRRIDDAVIDARMRTLSLAQRYLMGKREEKFGIESRAAGATLEGQTGKYLTIERARDKMAQSVASGMGGAASGIGAASGGGGYNSYYGGWGSEVGYGNYYGSPRYYAASPY